MKSLRGARQHTLPRSYLCAKIQDCNVEIRKLVLLLFSGDLWDLLENWKYEEASYNSYQPAATATLMDHSAVLERWVCVCCQQPFSKRTLATESDRYIPWPSLGP